MTGLIIFVILHFLSGVFVAWRLSCYGFLSKQKTLTSEDIVMLLLLPFCGFMSLMISLPFGNHVFGYDSDRKRKEHRNPFYKKPPNEIR